VDLIQLDFQDLCSAYEHEPALKQVFDRCNGTTTFTQGWGYYVLERFTHLKTFCGGLVTAFPATSTVKSNFSVVKWEKDDCQIGLMVFSQGGILHAKQFTRLQSMSSLKGVLLATLLPGFFGKDGRIGFVNITAMV
jgi:hypothetical protein